MSGHERGYQASAKASGVSMGSEAMKNPAKRIVTEERYYHLLQESRKDLGNLDIIPALSFFSGPRDPVSGWVGFNWWPSRYTNNQSRDHLPGAVRTRFWGSLFSFPAMSNTVNPHSCYGLNCKGAKYNWTVEETREWRGSLQRLFSRRQQDHQP